MFCGRDIQNDDVVKMRFYAIIEVLMTSLMILIEPTRRLARAHWRSKSFKQPRRRCKIGERYGVWVHSDLME